MTKIKIATDSTADIPKSLVEELNIAVLPLTILAGDKEYLDGVDITPEEFYRVLETADKLPVSSQVSVTLYQELFEKTWREGYTDIIHVILNSKGSGTYQAGVLARDLFLEEHKEAAEQFRIHLIDSGTYSMAYGWAAVEAARMAAKGEEVAAIIAHIQDWVSHARPMLVPLSLKFVKKSGRVSAAAAFVGDAIGLKPMITFEQGESKVVGKARGEKKAVRELVELCRKERRPGTPYMLVYGNNQEQREQLRELCREMLDQPPTLEYPVGCIISINTGPNMVALIYRT